MRSQGQVRFIKVTTRTQILAFSVVSALALAWLLSMAVMAISQYTSTRDRLALLDREAKVETAESRVDAYRKNLNSVASDLDRRQDVIEKLVQAHIGDLPQDAQAGDTVSNSDSAAAATVRKVSAALPEATGLARIEARQLAFIERLTRFADRRAERDSTLIRGVGLDPAAMLSSLEDRSAQGGPFIGLATAADGSLDPRFQRLGASLARMSAIAQGLAGIPHALPASLEFISSGFGFRSDPFNGSAAFHAGLDFRGPYGAPIYAAARGVVSFVGQRSGYGNCVEIDHGNASGRAGRPGRCHRRDRQHRAFHRSAPALRSPHSRPPGQSQALPRGRDSCFQRSRPSNRQCPRVEAAAARPSRSSARIPRSPATSRPRLIFMSMVISRATLPAPRWCRANPARSPARSGPKARDWRAS
jgi:murein DD-endopeptidase MepM/ murein hydrolase activator NlpD